MNLVTKFPFNCRQGYLLLFPIFVEQFKQRGKNITSKGRKLHILQYAFTYLDCEFLYRYR